MYSMPVAEVLVQVAGGWAAVFLPVAIKSSLLLGLLLLAIRALRSASAASRHLMWALGMAGLLVLPLLETALPTWQLVPILRFERPSQVPARERTSSPANTPLPEAAEGPQTAVAAPSTERLSAHRPGTVDPLPTRAMSLPASVWLLSTWLVGMLPLGAAFVWGMVRVGQLRRTARSLTGDGWPELLQSLSRELGLASPPLLLCSPRVRAPMTWGPRSPFVLLPADCRRWTPAQRREVLLHELAHVRRRDCLTQLGAQLVCMVHWFNPLAWVAARHMRTERERACDDLVLLAGTRPSSYARHLLDIATRLGTEERMLAIGLAMARRSRIFERLDAVLDPELRRLAPGRSLTLFATAFALAIVLPLAMLGPSVQAVETHRANIVIENGSNPIRVAWDGEIRLTPDGRAIEWMADEARLKLEQTVEGERRTLVIEPSDAGKPRHEYTVGKKEQEFDAKAASWLADVLHEIAPHGELEFPEPPTPPALPALPAIPAVQPPPPPASPAVPSVPSPPSVPPVPPAAPTNIRIDGSDTQVTWTSDRDGASWKMDIEGRVEFDEDDTRIVRMGEDARFRLEEKKGRKRTSVEATAGESGQPVYEYRVGGKTQPFDDAAAQWLTAGLQHTLLELGINADTRVRRVYERDGARGILNMIDRVDSDYVLGLYYREYFAIDGLGNEAIASGLEQLSRQIDSDYEMASVLIQSMDAFLASAATRTAFARCLGEVDSDYEKARVLTAALASDGVDADAVSEFLIAVGEIDSDYEAARVLTAVDPSLLAEEATRSVYFRTLAAIGSDYEKAGVLIGLARHARRDEKLRAACLEAANSIASSYEHDRVERALQ